jgi:hypothetical protein
MGCKRRLPATALISNKAQAPSFPFWLSVPVAVAVLAALMRQLGAGLAGAVVAVEGKIGAFFVPLMFLHRSLC